MINFDDSNSSPVILKDCSTLVDLLRYRALHQPHQRAFTFLKDGEVESGSLTYQEMDQQSRRIATHLQSLGFTGERALLLYPPGLDYLTAFFGCLYAGIVAVPAYPPHNQRNTPRILAVVNDAEAAIALTTTSIQSRVQSLLTEKTDLPRLQWLTTDDLAQSTGSDWRIPPLQSESLAFLQYTSGSTGTPKGVMLSHGNLLHNATVLYQLMAHPPDSIGVSWLPIYHDMGLIGGIMQPLYGGFPCILMPPASFLQRPYRWLQAISKYRGTISSGPNFAYELCIQKITAEQRQRLDLSSWTAALTGAEPVRLQTLERFAAEFAACGFRSAAFYPCYGMAEATLIVSGGRKVEPPIVKTVQKAALEQNCIVEIEAGNDLLDETHSLVGCGQSVPQQQIIIAHPETLTRCAPDEVGEIWVSGPSVGRGYWGRSEETAQTFQAYLTDTGQGPFLRTSDLGFLCNGELFITGRAKDLIIIRGRNLYPQDIELTAEQSHPALRAGGGAAFGMDVHQEEKLVIVQELEFRQKPDLEKVVRAIRRAIAQAHEVEAYAVVLIKPGKIPKTSSGKIQRHACKAGLLAGNLEVVGSSVQSPMELGLDSLKGFELKKRIELDRVAPKNEIEQKIALIWQELSGLEQVGIDDNFFELGGDSLLMTQARDRLQLAFNCDISTVELFEYPTIKDLADYLSQHKTEKATFAQAQERAQRQEAAIAEEAKLISKEGEWMNHRLKGIAIIGMAGKFPGAKSVAQFWQNLCNGVESISYFSDEELLASGVDQACLQDPSYVKAGFVLEDVEMFDASFFGYSPREAEILDPQQRVFLECAWAALEDAGYNPKSDHHLTGVYAGGNLSTYLLNNLALHPELLKSHNLPIALGNDKDSIATRVSYKLNLKGPSVSVGTECSTSLVAVHLACRGLLSYQCDMALAGGVAIQVPQVEGYFYQADGMASPDGRTRAFDARANGVFFGRGVGIVVLKRLEDAVAHGDYIYGVIKGSAINNDGAMKVSYTAPSVAGQAEAIAEAQAIAGFDPETITYIETHGTGTVLGDPIEIQALEKVFRAQTNKKGYCAIGSVKTNVSHLSTAAGVTSLIKTALALKHQQLPPSLNFEEPNPEIDFANSPFYVNTQLSNWQTNGTPRRAGVSSFGLGGTNAHVVLEEAPAITPAGPSRPWRLLLLSAKTAAALETATTQLTHHLRQHPKMHPADVAYTLQVGRQPFEHRRMVVCQSLDEAVQSLETREPKRVLTRISEDRRQSVVLMFSGQGSQYLQMGRDLYEYEPVFRKHVDHCCERLQSHLDLDLRQVLYANPPTKDAAVQLRQTAIAQPALFVIEYALAQLLGKWSVHPEAMIGHSIGEYVAATMAGVFSLEDALAVVATRGKLMQQLPAGSMLAIPLPEQQVQSWLEQPSQQGASCQIAAVNSPSACVVSGSQEAVASLQNQLSAQGIEYRLLHTSHAFHSEMMEPILEPFVQVLKTVKLNPPRLRFISNVTGDWITAEQATSPSYWGRQLRQAVRFSAGISQLLEQFEGVFLEVGPGRTLSTLTTQHLQPQAKQQVLSSLHHAKEPQSDVSFLLQTLGRLWLAGVEIDWSGFYAHERRHRLPLPTYPFERQRYWIEPPKQTTQEYQPLRTTPELWKSLVEAGQIQANVGTSEFDEQIYLEKLPSLEALCLDYMNIALRQLGAFKNPSQRYSIEELFEQCQIIPRYRQLLSRWLHVLVEHGQLQQDGELFSHLAPCSTDSVNALLKDVRLTWIDTFIEIDLIQRCGENLVSVLTGNQEPLEFFQDVIYDFDEKEDINKQSPWNTYYNRILQAIMKQVATSLSPLGSLRILEVGGGQGLATRELLPLLPSQQTNYTFTDVGGSFLNSGKKKFRAYPFIEYRFLDIEQPPTEQGYEDYSFDVVIAVNVLHVTKNMAETLQHVRSLLAPNGLLLLWETTQETLYFDITWGLLMNPLEDEERSRGNPFLSKEQWQEALCRHGFVEVAAFPETEALAQHILVAQASASAALPAPAAFTAPLEQKAPDRTLQAPLALDKKPDIADWFYIPSWKRFMPPQPFQSGAQATQPGCWLVFVDECGLGAQILKRPELEGHDVITVRIGEQFSSKGKSPNSQRTYTINPQQRGDYNTLLNELIALNLRPTKIVHLWNVTPQMHTVLRLEDINQAQDRGFYSLLFLAQTLEEQNMTDELQIAVISNNLQSVTGEEMLAPEKATLLGLVKVISLEYPSINCCSIDVVLPEASTRQEEKLLGSLLAELSVNTSDKVVAYRGVHRWTPAFEPVRLDAAFDETPRLRQGGVYLITGGLGIIGLALASHLAKTVQAKLILTGRSDFPAKADWQEWLANHDDDDNVSCKIGKLKELEELGAEILVARADVADFEKMQQVITQSQERFGPINGVVHAAGVLGEGMIGLKTREEIESVFAPKVRGTLVLDAILKDVELDFMVLCSSGASIAPGFGQMNYSSANNFLDAFSHYKTARDRSFTVSINWGVWQESGMAVEAAKKLARSRNILQPQSNSSGWHKAPSSPMREFQADFLKYGFLPSEGIEIFRRILGSTQPQVLISTTDLDLLAEINNNNAGQTLSSLGALKKPNLPLPAEPIHSRPELSNAYVAPRNEVEKRLTDIWQEVLGIKQIGIYDNFFELGGDSLMATQVLSQVRKTLRTELSVRRMLEIPTVAGVSEQIENTRLALQKQQTSITATLGDREEEVF